MEGLGLGRWITSKWIEDAIGLVDVAWIHPAPVKVHWRVLLDTVMNLQISQKRVIYRWSNQQLLKMASLHEVSSVGWFRGY
jgi:hypothetical protein